MKQAQSEVYDSLASRWREYIQGLEDALNKVEEQIDEAAQMSEQCTSEWCTATEHYIDDLATSLFSIHEPKFSSDEDTQKLKRLKKRVYELYAKYKNVAST